MKTRTSLRTMFGEEMLPALSSAAVLEGVSTERLLRRIRREYEVTAPRWLVHEAYSQWLAVNAKRLIGMAREIGDPLLERTLKAFAA